MRTLFIGAMALAICAVAGAQEAPKPLSFMAMPSSTGGHSLLRLLRRAEVVTHLGLSLYQQKAIKDLAEDPNSGRLRISVQSQGNTPPDPQQIKQDIENQIAEQQKGVMDKIKDILKPEQFSRTQELAIQWKAALSLADSTVAEKGQLSGPH